MQFESNIVIFDSNFSRIAVDFSASVIEVLKKKKNLKIQSALKLFFFVNVKRIQIAVQSERNKTKIADPIWVVKSHTQVDLACTYIHTLQNVARNLPRSNMWVNLVKNAKLKYRRVKDVNRVNITGLNKAGIITTELTDGWITVFRACHAVYRYGGFLRIASSTVCHI